MASDEELDSSGSEPLEIGVEEIQSSTTASDFYDRIRTLVQQFSVMLDLDDDDGWFSSETHRRPRLQILVSNFFGAMRQEEELREVLRNIVCSACEDPETVGVWADVVDA